MKRTQRTASDPEETPFACPECSSSFDSERGQCRACNRSIAERHGILSFAPTTDPETVDRLEADRLEALAMQIEQRPLREAVSAFISAHDYDDQRRESLRDELFDLRRDAWLALAADGISGRCLHLPAGFGRRSKTLGALAESVYAVNPHLSMARVVAGRADVDDDVVSIHAPTTSLPFADGAFDTIVAELTGTTGESFGARLDQFSRLLADDGALYCLVNGWSRRFDRRGDRQQSFGTATQPRPTSSPVRFRSAIRSAGFDELSVLALVPSADEPIYVFDADSSPAATMLSSLVISDGGLRGRLASSLVEAASRLKLLNRCYPGYLFACGAGHRSRPSSIGDPFAIGGRARTVVLDLGDDGVEQVWKFPNASAHAPLTERENRVLESLAGSKPSVAKTLPAGDAVTGPLGTGRVERPVSGSPLVDVLEGTNASFRTVLETGFSWLASFQRDHRGQSIQHSPSTVRRELSFDPGGITPPPVSESVQTFTVPIHGDYTPQNVYVDDGEVTGVIDWEYGSPGGNPIVDAGILVLTVANRQFGGFEAGYEKVFRRDTEASRIARSLVREYCDAVGLPYQSFDRYLPISYLHRLRLDWLCEAASTYTETMNERLSVVEQLIERPSALASGTLTRQ